MIQIRIEYKMLQISIFKVCGSARSGNAQNICQSIQYMLEFLLIEIGKFRENKSRRETPSFD